MNLGKNKINSLLVGIFIAYWLFVVLSQVFSHPRVAYVKSTLPGQLLFPPTYKMYTSPPKNIVESHYIFYKDGNQLYTVNVDSLYHAKILYNFPSLKVKRDVKQHLKLFYSPNFDMVNAVYNYSKDTVIQNEKSLQNYLESIKYQRINISNQLEFSSVIKYSLSQLNNADSAELIIERKYNAVEMDPSTYSKPASYLPDTIWVRKTKVF